ncbi:glycosyl transferase, family 2 [Shewanella sediminis HAW-EB3]|uniref:Glycosyl transferase, family 2 n=1 Tax=Shewanella sediminis (strain HAW-EB3) TaxID=425104 RepID=A8FXP8_SHESH|nr:glycosyltransferase family 2 protein [Shewanella sediminis]ABV37621.1 glycosyl transferase, family 2 [Shewanella sediminis HAW-EB3]
MKQAIVIPAFNEEKTICKVIESVRPFSDFDIIVVDDGSADSTSSLVKQFEHVILLPLATNLGAWKAMQTGIRFCYENDYQRVITFDADGQHLPDSILALTSFQKASNSDVVIGSCTQRGSVARHIAWRLFRKLSGVKIMDITSGLRLYNRAAMSVLSTREATLLEYQDVGVLLMLKNFGLSFDEVKVEMEPRQDGISRIFHSWWAVAYYMTHTSLLCISKARKNSELQCQSSLNR